MGLINKPLCATEYGNVGYGDCYLEPGKIVGAIQVPLSFEISEGDLPTLQEILLDGVHATLGARIFPYHNFTGVTDSTEDVTINTTDYGSKDVVRDGYYDFTFRYKVGGVMLHQQIQKNKGTGKAFLFYTEDGTVLAYRTRGRLKGIPTEVFYVNPWRPATGAETAIYTLRFIINPRYMNYGNLGFVKVTDFNLFDIQGLQEMQLELVSIASNVAVVRAFTKISAVDLHDAFAAAMARTSAWRAENEDGIPIAITAVTDNVASGGWNITFNLSAFNAADKVLLRSAIASVLRAAPILMEGFEGSEPLEIEGPVS